MTFEQAVKLLQQLSKGKNKPTGYALYLHTSGQISLGRIGRGVPSLATKIGVFCVPNETATAATFSATANHMVKVCDAATSK